MNINTVIRKAKELNPKCDSELIKKAYWFASFYHVHQKRESGEPYIQHPLHVAEILVEHGLDEKAIAAALLHDLLEDTAATKEDIEKEFGEKVASLVEGVTKITKLDVASKDDYDAENIRKVIIASTKDIRVILIKLADKLHNMRTIGGLPPERRKRISREVMDIYVPIAYKLGIASIKNELEDRSFKILYPSIYSDLEKKLERTRKGREKEMVEIKKVLESELKKHKMKVYVLGRVKQIFSIYRKMKKRHLLFEEVQDIIGFRLITKTVKDCYQILGIMHSIWRPIPNLLDDYIAMPKSNMYQSLHTTVIASNGKTFEVQIRTEEMHKTAEEGIAAHWKYKGICGDKDFDQKLSWMRQLLDWQKASHNSQEFVDMLHVDFFEDEIYTFTPKGRVITLPKYSCVIDFAYAIHTDVGKHCSGAIINGKFATLRTVLKNGDLVEILTSKTKWPTREWLKFVRSSRAKSKIKQHIKETQDVPVKVVSMPSPEKRGLEEWIVDVEGIPDARITLAKCCNPVPGDMIMGYSSRSKRVMIHKVSCLKIAKLKRTKKSKVEAYWVDTIGSIVEVKVDAFNRVGLFAEVLNAVVATQTQIKSAKAKSLGEKDVECSFTIEARSIQQLQKIIARVRKIKDVTKVYIGSMR
ncbi:MAG: bifunctional (p)ppGpp synthetase/guanosine-3',5'-bis(diphosphate) 3'-pyrophosphohydrolase [Candidatus Woesearchaeota archaeon]